MNPIKAVKGLLRLRKAEGEWRAMEVKGSDPQKVVAKGTSTLLISGLVVGLMGAIGFLSDPEFVQRYLGGSGLPPGILALLVPIIASGAAMARNAIKHRYPNLPNPILDTEEEFDAFHEEYRKLRRGGMPFGQARSRALWTVLNARERIANP